MKRVALVLVVLSSLMFSGSAEAGHADPAGYHWGGSGDRTVAVLDSVSGGWDAALTTAAAQWSASPFINLAVTQSKSTKAYRKKCPFGNNAIRVCNANYGAKPWAGLAQVSYTVGSGHITQARVRLNTYYVKDAPYTIADACHEIGHTLGLDHRDQMEAATTCMTPELTTTTSPDVHDLSEVAVLHDHAHALAKSGSHPGEEITVTRRGGIATVTIKLLARP